jgi:hypothetical protein
MKSLILLFSVFLLVVSTAVAQDMQYVSKQSGDTLYVKDDIAFGSTNTLYNLMVSDSLAPASRVYLLVNGGIYSIVNNPVTAAKYRTIIMGQTQTSLKVSQGAPPPILSGSYATGVNTTGGINVNNDLLIKNCDIEIGNGAGSIGWGFFGFNGSGERIEVDNCIVEHTWWTVIGGPPTMSRMFFKGDYFVNLDGHTCRRNGGILDFFSNQDTILVENCTHVNTQGSLWKFRYGDVVNKVVFNHNDFIDNSGYVFMNNGDQTHMSVTNNIFVNSQLQGFAPVLEGIDVGEVDADSLAIGLINVRVDSIFIAGGKSFYADRNLAYWDASLANIPATLNSAKVNGATNWVSQMIPMNSRTTALFKDKTNYPLLVNGTWYSKLPAFKKTDVLFTSQLATIKAFAIATVDTSYGTPMSSWRQASNPEASNFIYADWPIPIDLSYTDSDLLKAGFSGFPLGDLDWFPTTHATWQAQESAELANINKTLATGVAIVDGVEKTPGVPQQFQLQQNYPNPFNPTTNINYSIPNAGFVSLKVYNVLGQEVATLVNGFQTAHNYNVQFDASKLASGIYLYSVKFNNQTLTQKMVLMK